MSKFTLEITTDNAAFGETEAERRDEIARVLRAVANRIDRSYRWGEPEGPIGDANGNLVGFCRLTKD